MQMTARQMTRRHFLTGAAAGAATVALGGSAIGWERRLASPRAVGANDRLRVGLIGLGERMQSLMGEFHGLHKDLNCEITAVCDIWRPNLIRGVKTVTEWYGKPVIYRDYREMLAANDLDGVIISTADSQHATMLRHAIESGKHTYCEKPTANDLADANALMDVGLANPKVVVQVGTQRRSEGIYAAAAEFLKSGQLGTLVRANVSWNYFGPRWRRSFEGVRREDVDWDRFLMGRVSRPFDPRVFREWRLFRDFSTGIPCQWLSHMMDAVHLVTGARFPRSCVAQGGTFVWKDGRENGDTFQALYEYPEGFIVNYSTTFCNSAGDDFSFYGTNGRLDGRSWKATGDGGGGEKLIKEEIKIQAGPSVGHVRNWVECVRAGKQPNAPLECGYQHSIAVILAVRALETGRKQMYDPMTRTVKQA